MLIRVLKDAWERYDAHGNLLAAAIAFYALLSFAPMLVIVAAMLSLFYDPAHMQARLLERMTELTSPDMARFVVRVMDAAEPTQGTLTALLATGMLFWAATRLFVQVQEALNLLWGVAPVRAVSAREAMRELVYRRVISFGMVLGCGLVVLCTLILQTIFGAVSEGLESVLAHFVDVSHVSIALLSLQQLVGALFLLTAVFAMIYHLLPDAQIRVSSVLAGSLLTAVLVQLGTWLLGLYLSRIAPSWLFGAVGSIAAFLLWIYYLAHVFLIGAAFTRAWAGRNGPPFEHKKAHAMRDGLTHGMGSRSRG